MGDVMPVEVVIAIKVVGGSGPALAVMARREDRRKIWVVGMRCIFVD